MARPTPEDEQGGVNGRLARRYSVSQVSPPAQICHDHPDHHHHLKSNGLFLSCATQIIMLSSSSLYSKSPSGQYWERASPSNWSWSGSSWVSWLACGHAYQLHLKNFSALRKMQCNNAMQYNAWFQCNLRIRLRQLQIRILNSRNMR